MAGDEKKLDEDSETTMVIEAEVVGQFRDKRGETRQAYVIVIAGPRVGHMVKLDEDELRVGRASGTDLQLNDRGVSRSHARLVKQEDGTCFIEDLSSSNGTFINGREISRPWRLEDGDKITLGTTTILKFTYQDELEETFQRKMYEASLRDGLTEAYNKEYLTDFLRSEISFARRHDTELSLLMFDIDYFKSINDSYGHLAGDDILVKLVERVRETVRAEDTLARYGGDEFVLVARNIGCQEAVEQGRRLRKAICEEAFVYEGTEFPVTISLGVAASSDVQPGSAEEFIDAADRALYQAKNSGRNKICAAR